MSLIKCPECQKEVSDKSKICIHCGFPISEVQLYNVVRPSLNHPGQYILEYENLTLEQAEKRKRECEDFDKEVISLGATIINTYEIVNSNADLDYCNLEMRKIKIPDPSILHCPKCGSTAITTGARGVNWTLGLIGAGKTVNRCGKCGHIWTPQK